MRRVDPMAALVAFGAGCLFLAGCIVAFLLGGLR